MSKTSLVCEADGKGVRETTSRKLLTLSLAQRREDRWPNFRTRKCRLRAKVCLTDTSNIFRRRRTCERAIRPVRTSTFLERFEKEPRKSASSFLNLLRISFCYFSARSTFVDWATPATVSVSIFASWIYILNYALTGRATAKCSQLACLILLFALGRV